MNMNDSVIDVKPNTNTDAKCYVEFSGCKTKLIFAFLQILCESVNTKEDESASLYLYVLIVLTVLIFLYVSQTMIEMLFLYACVVPLTYQLNVSKGRKAIRYHFL